MLRRYLIRKQLKFSHVVIFFFLSAIGYLYISRTDESPPVRDTDHSQKNEQIDVTNDISEYRRDRFIRYQSRRSIYAPGENGAGVRLSKEEQDKADSLFEKEAFNIVASDKISLERSVKDTRDSGYGFAMLSASLLYETHSDIATLSLSYEYEYCVTRTRVNSMS